MTRRLVAGYLILTVVVLVVLMVPLGIAHHQNLVEGHDIAGLARDLLDLRRQRPEMELNACMGHGVAQSVAHVLVKSAQDIVRAHGLMDLV